MERVRRGSVLLWMKVRKVGGELGRGGMSARMSVVRAIPAVSIHAIRLVSSSLSILTDIVYPKF